MFIILKKIKKKLFPDNQGKAIYEKNTDIE